jgi:flagellar biosynthesis protein FliP
MSHKPSTSFMKSRRQHTNESLLTIMALHFIILLSPSPSLVHLQHTHQFFLTWYYSGVFRCTFTTPASSVLLDTVLLLQPLISAPCIKSIHITGLVPILYKLYNYSGSSVKYIHIFPNILMSFIHPGSGTCDLWPHSHCGSELWWALTVSCWPWQV